MISSLSFNPLKTIIQTPCFLNSFLTYPDYDN